MTDKCINCNKEKKYLDDDGFCPECLIELSGFEPEEKEWEE